VTERNDRQVIFVCQHGAFRSRIAAAYFNAAPPDGWSADSAGVTPQTEVSERLVPLLAGTAAADYADLGRPRPLRENPGSRVVALDADVAGATAWRLSAGASDEELREEIEQRVLALVHELGNG
jgi:protein-tyrosine-phosphatase